MIFMVPAADETPWPTLGPWVVEFVEENLVHGPGDLLGRPVTLNDEQKAWIYRMYEVFPRFLVDRKLGVVSKRPNSRAGRRRFQRCALSLRKGSSKTEFAAWIAAAELHHDGPVRCVGWNGNEPIPGPVTDPYIPMISYTEEQTEELAYGALRRILEESRIAGDFDIGLERIMRRTADGKAEAVSASPNARDGARTTFQHADETHRFTLDSLRRGWTVMLANLAKRPLADPWALETTTAPEPGVGSVAETTMEYARTLAKDGRSESSRMFFFHRQASDESDIDSPDGLRVALAEASGPFISAWSDLERIGATFHEPDADRSYLERVWLNRPVQSAGRAFDVAAWRGRAREFVPPDSSAITLGFSGGRFDDSAAAIIATHVETGFQWPVGVWERPAHLKEWEIAGDEVDATVVDAFARWWVCRLYADPPQWESWIAKWSGQYEKRVFEWWTKRIRPMAYAIRSYLGAIKAGELSHDGNARFEAHLANARRMHTNLTDDQDKPLWILRKERPDSPDKIDAAKAAVLSWEARNDAIAAGEGRVPELSIHILGD
jgi:hypothetical protein